MPAKQKSRIHRESPNTAGKIRNDKQHAAYLHNISDDSELTPWEASKVRRSINRRRQGKTYANWEKKQKDTSNYKSRGRDKIAEFTKHPDIKPGTGIAYDIDVDQLSY